MFTLREAHLLSQRLHAEEYLPGGIRERDLVGGVRLGSVGEVLRRELHGVKSGASIASAAKFMLQEGVSALLVLRDAPYDAQKNERPVGRPGELTRIVWGRPETSRQTQAWLRPGDLAGLVCAEDLEGVDPNGPVSSVMRPPAYLDAETSLAEAAQCLRETGLAFAPVASGGLLAGIVWRSDLNRGVRLAR
jgi:CBS domain-containing protein